jgi:endonuclease/exonuclease/phosphatase family metal-dependent hydrolase
VRRALALLGLVAALARPTLAQVSTAAPTDEREARFEATLADSWRWVGSVLCEPDYHVWGASPVVDSEGRVHLFASRWPVSAGFDPGWRSHSEIAHYVGDSPRGPFELVSVVAAGDGEGWDASGHHNPSALEVDGRYVLAYISNSGLEGHPANQRIGMRVADDLDGPWLKLGDDGLVLAPSEDGWNAGSPNGVNNPALLRAEDGRFLLYFKSTDTRPGRGTQSVMGLAVAESLDGPFVVSDEPITSNARSIEDGAAFAWRGGVRLLTTDNHGILERGGGLLWSSRDGLEFDAEPAPGFHLIERYLADGVPAEGRRHYGQAQPKLERPQLLLRDGEPAFLFAPSGTNLEGGAGTCVYLLERTAAREDLRALTFNIRYGRANDGPDRWELRAEKVLGTIRDRDPDLLGLQEALPFQAAYITGSLPTHEHYGPSRMGPDTQDEACTLLWRRERFEALERGTFWLSEMPGLVASRGWDAALPRVCSWVRLRDRTTGVRFVFANTHFDHRGAEARLESARLLAAHFASEERVLLMGDLNAGEDSAPLRALQAGGFVDTFRSLHPDAEGVGTFTGFREAPGQEKIDHVLLRGAVEVDRADIDRRRPGGRWPSDHFPVGATVRWR